MFKTTLTAAAVALSVALPAVAQTLPAPPQPWWEKGVRSDLTDEQIKSACRLSAAGIFPNLLDAWDNEMRSRTYQNCLSWQQRGPQRANQPQRPPVAKPQQSDVPPEELDKFIAGGSCAVMRSGVGSDLGPAMPIICNSPRLKELNDAADVLAIRLILAHRDPPDSPYTTADIGKICGTTSSPQVEDCYARLLQINYAAIRQWQVSHLRARQVKSAPR
jgi:hypothetical protein